MRKILSTLFSYLIFSSTLVCAASEDNKPIEFCFILCSYNNVSWCEKNLESVFCQTYPHWSIYFVDDCSTDGTGKKVDNYVRARGMSHKCTIIHNETRQGGTINLYNAIWTCSPKTVAIIFDGDDFLKSPFVLETLVKVYSDPSVWITYGSDEHLSTGQRAPNCHAFPLEVMENRSFRNYTWVGNHLRSFYAALFHKIRKEDMMYRGKFVPICSDLAYMLPMFEMASQGHIRYIEEILYIYNDLNPLNDLKRRPRLNNRVSKFLASKEPYLPLEKLF